MIKDWIEIDGYVFNVFVTEITETAKIEYSDKSGKTISKNSRVALVPLGTAYSHQIKVIPKGKDLKDFDFLFDYITKPVNNGFHIKAVHGQRTIEYDGYINASVSRKVKFLDTENKKVYWKEITINITPMEMQVLPL